MPIKFSDHVIIQLKERHISKIRVKEAVESPDVILSSFKSRQLRQKEFGGNILEVVTVTEGSRITIITAYYIQNNKD